MSRWQGCALAAAALAACAVLAPGRQQARAETPRPAQTSATPPPLPPLGDAVTRAQALFDAVKRDAPEAAMDFFLPRAAFAKIKATANPDPIYDHLVAAYARDIHALHATLGDLDDAVFVRVQLSLRRSFVLPGEEANRLPYWAQRHNALVYRVGQKERSFELRVLIAWEGRWYLTHLSEWKKKPT